MALPDEKEVRAALGRLVAHGIDSVWLPGAQALLELPAVHEKIEQLGSDRAADALRQVLSASVESLGQSQYRRLLTIVLGLEPEYANLTAGHKRQVAGREFRGGSKPVSAGTIRQHHEPKALDELAAVLCKMPAPVPGSGGESAAEHSLSTIEWHPVLHNLWAGERLVFWRLSFGVYDSVSARERVQEAMERAEISSWVAYEAIGGFDLLIRAWLPSILSPADFGAKVFGGLGDLQLHYDFFVVDRVIRHWPWMQGDRTMREPSRDLLASGIPSRDIESINTGIGSDRFRDYQEKSLVTPVHEKRGIGFMVAVASPGPAVVPSLSQQTMIEEGIADLLGRAEGSTFSELSLYAGSGFARYLILGRVGPSSFNELGDSLVRPLGEAVAADGGRTYTFILSASAPLARVERMPVDTSDSMELSAEELLMQDESTHLEVIARTSADDSGHTARFGAHLARAVTGFLNADGGTIVIGAAERERVQHGNPQVAELFAGAPAIGKYVVRGVIEGGSEGVDAFERRLLDTLAKRIEPEPSNFVQVRVELISDRMVCVLTVPRIIRSDSGPWFYYREGRGSMQFFVRRGFQSVKLAGAEADAYKMQKAGAKNAVFTA